jgi:hypothetical protein
VSRYSIAVVSDIHYAGPGEIGRSGHESKAIGNPLLRGFVGVYRYYIWLRDVFAHNHLLEYFLDRVPPADLVIGNGDYSCDTAFIGSVDPAAFESASLCLGKLREAYGDRFVAVMGDHELGKKSIFGGAGGMRLLSWEQARSGLKIEPFWIREVGVYRVIGITSSLVALPVFDADLLEDEVEGWNQIREKHLQQIEGAFESLSNEHKVILFCHDPSAIPFLERMDAVRQRVDQIEQTIIGHLHSDLILRMSGFLSGMPHITSMGSTVNRLSAALCQARCWPPFKLRLCPSLAGIELLKDGGFLELQLDPSGREPLKVMKRPVPREGLNDCSG